MNKNKKTILGFAMAMIFSLALMQGVATTSNKQDMSLQQLTVGAGYMAGETEGGASGAWTAAAGIGTGVTSALFYGSLANTWNPLGWVGWAATGAAAL
ncbi:MAG: hypothetical protein L3J08_03460 [Flavobacteriaceae bacterium]|nr:hypothetical protein [Flavobacteriaceae bacterium]